MKYKSSTFRRKYPKIESREATPPQKALLQGETLPYDASLLERAKTQWQFGDWQSLTEIEPSVLQNHPDGAKLALLAATGFQQQGKQEDAKKWASLALEWGCNRTLLTRFLIAGVYNTLGCAAMLSENKEKAVHLLQSSLTTGIPGSDTRLLLPMRVSQQVRRLGLPESSYRNLFPLLEEKQSGMERAIHPLAQMMEQLRAENGQLLQLLKQQQNELVSARKAIEGAVKKEVTNATRQMEAYMGVQRYLQSGELTPALHGWPISPDFALYMLELIEKNDYDLIIEFGSGSSTVLIAQAVKNIATRKQNPKQIKFISFDHLQEFFDNTLLVLIKNEIADCVELTFSPLVSYKNTDTNMEEYKYYNQDIILKTIKPYLKSRCKNRILVIVDGPPAFTCKHARYPSVPLIAMELLNAKLDILLDDYNRKEEKEVTEKWMSFFKRENINFHHNEIQSEKGAILISCDINKL